MKIFTPFKCCPPDRSGQLLPMRDAAGNPVARTCRSEHDSRLLAAAPALYFALQETGNVIEAHLAHGDVKRDGWCRVLQHILDALNSAS